MVIKNDESLLLAIEQLKHKQKFNGQVLRQHYQKINETYSTVYQVNNFLPEPVPAGVTINKLMDEVLLDGAKTLTKNFKSKDPKSLFANAGNNLLDNAIKLIVSNNKLKIKVYTIAIIKNILN